MFAPLRDVGLIVVSRECHPAHREDRAPYYHVRDVALAAGPARRARRVLSALCPSSEKPTALGIPVVTPADAAVARRWRWCAPDRKGGPLDSSSALRAVRRGFIFAPMPGYGIAQVCRSCGRPAACAACGGLLRAEAGQVRCIVCAAHRRCCASAAARPSGSGAGGPNASRSGRRGAASVPVARPSRPRLPRSAGEILVGGAELGRAISARATSDLVADPRRRSRGAPAGAGRARARAGHLDGGGRLGPAGGRVPSCRLDARTIPPIQALVRGNPDRFHARRAGATRRGRVPGRRPPCSGSPVATALEAALADIEPLTMLVTTRRRPDGMLARARGRTGPRVQPSDPRPGGARGRRRVEAEPHL